jgi:hypothetical protein
MRVMTGGIWSAVTFTVLTTSIAWFPAASDTLYVIVYVHSTFVFTDQLVIMFAEISQSISSSAVAPTSE